MQPLPIRTRRLYLASLIVVFVAAFPFIVLYATGYHFSRDFTLVETGGIFVSLEVPGATISVNDSVAGRSTLLDRSFLRQNLKSGIYSVKVERDGFYPWVKVLSVVPSYVTDARAVFIPTAIEKIELLAVALRPKGATSTPGASYLSPAALKSVTTAFTATSTATMIKLAASGVGTTTPIAEVSNVGLFVEKGNLIARFNGATSTAPSNFCISPILCTSEIAVEKAKEVVTNADFLFDDPNVAIYTSESGIYVAEIDVRSPQLLVPLYPVRGADFRFVDGDLIIKDGKKYYRLQGF